MSSSRCRAGSDVEPSWPRLKGELGAGRRPRHRAAPGRRCHRHDLGSAAKQAEGEQAVIVRILGEGQSTSPTTRLDPLNALDGAARAAVEAGDEARFRSALRPCSIGCAPSVSRCPTTPSSPPSCPPPAEATLAEVRQLLAATRASSPARQSEGLHGTHSRPRPRPRPHRPDGSARSSCSVRSSSCSARWPSHLLGHPGPGPLVGGFLLLRSGSSGPDRPVLDGWAGGLYT